MIILCININILYTELLLIASRASLNHLNTGSYNILIQSLELEFIFITRFLIILDTVDKSIRNNLIFRNMSGKAANNKEIILYLHTCEL